MITLKEEDYLSILSKINSTIILKDSNGNIVHSISHSEKENFPSNLTPGLIEINNTPYILERLNITLQGVNYILEHIKPSPNLEAITQEMQQQIRIDPLTQVLNRNGFFYELQKLITSQSPFSLIYCDIDDFSNVNNTFGHNYGDYVLQLIGKTLTQNLRRTDVISRFGGDEFTILIQSTDDTKIKEILTKIQHELTNEFLLGNTKIEIKISFGFTIYNHHKPYITNLEHADEALYFTKNNNKGGISFYDEINKSSNKKL